MWFTQSKKSLDTAKEGIRRNYEDLFERKY
jgi:hypothetical protein